MAISQQGISLDYAPRPRGVRVRRAWLWVLVSVFVLVLGLVWLFRTRAAIKQRNAAQVTKAIVDAALLQMALDQFEGYAGRLPTAEEGLGALLNPPPNVTDWHGPYIRNAAELTDPWGNPYIYHPAPGRKAGQILVRSAGRDGKEGTADDIFFTP